MAVRDADPDGNKPHARAWTRLHDAIVKNRKVLGILSAFVVFATFIAKDMIRETIKDQIDSIQSAENVFFSRAGEQSALETAVSQLKQSFEANHYYPEKELRERYNALFSDRRLQGFVQVDRFQRFEESLDFLVEHLPPPPDSVRKEQKQFNDANARLKKAYNRLIELDDELSKLPKESQHFRGTLFDEDDVSGIVAVMPVDVGLAAIRASRAAIKFGDESKKRLERYNTAAFWISCALYILGWGIGLVSQIVGAGSGSVE